MTLEMIASHAGLGFLPVQEERYDFVVPRPRTTRTGVIAFTTRLAQPSTRDAVAPPRDEDLAIVALASAYARAYKCIWAYTSVTTHREVFPWRFHGATSFVFP